MRSTPLQLALLAILQEGLLARVSTFGDLRQYVVETISVLLGASLVYLVSVWLVLRGARGAHWMVAVAVVFRLTLWPPFPAFSDDVFRYRWEGKLQADGGNPYQVRPVDYPGDATYPNLPGKDFKAGYGPLVELEQRLVYQAVAAAVKDPFGQVFWFKLPAALADLGVIGALWALLKARGLPAERVLIYAWCPLPIFEFWASGHNDALAILLIVLALAAAANQRWLWAFVWLSLAGCAKIWPLALFPLFMGWKERRWRQALVLIPIAALSARPFWSNVTENAQFMSGFLGGWRNNDSLYGLLLWLTGDVYGAKYLAFALLAALVAAVTLWRPPLENGVLAVLAGMLIISANCHPWYLTWLLPLLAMVPLPALLLWMALVPLAYQVLIGWTTSGVWNGVSPMRWWIYGPVLGMAVGSWLCAQANRWLYRSRIQS